MTETRQLKVMGYVALGAALLIVAVVALQPEGLKGPAWVAYLAATAFGFAGISSLMRAYRRNSLADALVCCLLAAMLLIELWVAFGPGTRQCAGLVSGFGWIPTGLACRSAFGIGAIVLGGMLVLAIRGWLRGRSEG